MKQFSKTSKIFTIIGIVAICLIIGAFSSYNGLVSYDEECNKAWGNLQSQYQRRADLIPNLVNTVKGYAKHEQQTLQDVVEARAKATQLVVNSEDMSAEKIQQVQRVQGELSTALGKLLSITENYPALKANENFSELQAQLEGTENRINESRQLYNESVQVYNVQVRKFPSNIVANFCGFEKKSAFEADNDSKSAPSVDF